MGLLAVGERDEAVNLVPLARRFESVQAHQQNREAA